MRKLLFYLLLFATVSVKAQQIGGADGRLHSASGSNFLANGQEINGGLLTFQTTAARDSFVVKYGAANIRHLTRARVGLTAATSLEYEWNYPTLSWVFYVDNASQTLTNGYGLGGGIYNGTTARTWFVDSLLFRTTANSLTLAQLQARFNAENLLAVTTRGNTTTTRIGAAGFDVTGVSGLGFINYTSQTTSLPAIPTTGINTFFNTNGFGWIRSNGIFSQFSGTGLTASRKYNLPNGSGTIALLDTTQNITGLYRFSVNPIVTGSAPEVTLTDGNGNSSGFRRTQAGNITGIYGDATGAGNLGKDLKFDGSTGRGTFSDAGFPTGASPFTFITNFKTTSTTGGAIKQFIRWGSITTAGQYVTVGISAGRVAVWSGTGATVQSPTSYADGIWKHLEVVYTGTNVIIYINGNSVINTAYAFNTTLGQGYLIASTGVGVPLSLDNTTVIPTAISAANVATNYNGGVPLYNPVGGTAIADWAFDEGTGTTTADKSGNGRTITLLNGYSWDNDAYVPLSTVGSTNRVTFAQRYNGQNNGDNGIDQWGGIFDQNRFLQQYTVYSSNNIDVTGMGKNGYWYYGGAMGIPTRNANGNLSENALVNIGGSGIAGVGNFWLGTNTLGNPTGTANTGVHTWDGNNMHAVDANGTDQIYAYASASRTRDFLDANKTLVLNGDYLSTTSTQYGGTLPTTTGWLADGSKLITVMAIGAGGSKIIVPTGFTLSGTSGTVTGSGTNGISIVKDGKVQLIAIGTNAYEYQMINGTATIIP